MASITPLPSPPSRDRLDTFDQDADAFLDSLPHFVEETNTLAASLSTLAAPGALAIPYVFSSSTTDADPGPGVLRLSNSSQSLSTILRLDDVSSAGDYWGTVIGSFDDATGANKGQIRVAKVGESSKWLVFTVLGIAGGTSGYWNIQLEPLAGSSTSPLVNGDSVLVFFTRTGDQGIPGSNATVTAQQIRDALGTLPIANGGTGATAPAAALTALGALSKAGGDMTGNIAFANNRGLFFKDSNGISRQTFLLAGDNNLYLNMGPGGRFRVENAESSATIFDLDNGGLITPSGGLLLGNNVPLYMKNANGTARAVAYIDPSNNLNYFGGLAGSRWFNSIGSAVLMSLTDAGAMALAGGVSATTGTFQSNVSCFDMTATSDERRKYGWQDVDHDLFVRGLASTEKAGRFWWKDDDRMDIGVGAQSVQRYAPEVVREGDDGVLRINQGALSTLGVVALARKLLDLEQRLDDAGIP